MHQERFHAERPTILVVDDDALVRWSLREGLAEHGYRVLEADDGSTALARAGDPTQLVILDHRLSDMSGLAVLAELKRRRPELPVMLLTAYGTDEFEAVALAAGASSVDLKPFDVAAVVARVDAVLAGSRR
jgi:DNA-binding response OmpR family regulator